MSLPHLRREKDPDSEMKPVQNPVILIVMHHRQNPLESTVTGENNQSCSADWLLKRMCSRPPFYVVVIAFVSTLDDLPFLACYGSAIILWVLYPSYVHYLVFKSFLLLLALSGNVRSLCMPLICVPSDGTRCYLP
jgi:hypothetical protein